MNSLSHSSQTRGPARTDHVAKIKPVTAAAAFGCLVGLAIGGAIIALSLWLNARWQPVKPTAQRRA